MLQPNAIAGSSLASTLISFRKRAARASRYARTSAALTAAARVPALAPAAAWEAKSIGETPPWLSLFAATGDRAAGWAKAIGRLWQGSAIYQFFARVLRPTFRKFVKTSTAFKKNLGYSSLMNVNPLCGKIRVVKRREATLRVPPRPRDGQRSRDMIEAYQPFERVVHSGWLEKRPTDGLRRALPLSGWRRRWFEVTLSNIVWRAGPGDAAKGSMSLVAAHAVPEVRKRAPHPAATPVLPPYTRLAHRQIAVAHSRPSPRPSSPTASQHLTRSLKAVAHRSSSP